MITFTHSSGQHLSIGDTSIYFEMAGNPSGQPLVLLHGGLGALTDFNGILARLPAQFSYIGIDLRGHGKSTLGSARLSYEQYQADVEAVLEHLGIGSFCLLGFSDGGIVGYRLAAHMPARVQKLITLGAQWRISTDDPTFEMLGSLTGEMWVEMFPESVAYYEKVNPQPDFDALVKAVVALWTDTGPTGYPHETVRNIEAPLLVIRGDEDHLFSLSEVVALRDRVQGTGFLNIPFVGYAAHAEAPDVLVTCVNDFLTR
jgi:pimeloyl-ACP methyl ester carboxylesterase